MNWHVRFVVGCLTILGTCTSGFSPIPAQAAPQCSDRKDNDRDGRTDYPHDLNCRSKNDTNERKAPNAILGKVGESLLGVQIFPSDNPWNTDISTAPVDPDSDQLIASIGADRGLHPDFGTFWEGQPIGIPYIVVRRGQPRVPISFYYPDESDRGPYPIPANSPIEGGERSNGDRHILILDRDAQTLFEIFDARRVRGGWSAGSGAIFHLDSNELRPSGWTSADAAGLPILPGLVRYDEVMIAGEIKHALRFTVSRSRRAYVPPATHFASSNSNSALPPMGMRVRLKAAVDITSYPAPVQVILLALKKYGMFVADNGSDWFISGAHDRRWNDDTLSTIRGVKGSDFEVIQMDGLVTE